ncbi:MAG: SDR family NAD(P)-dependent oxidoreductase [Gammaproteobacteria bacterium]
MVAPLADVADKTAFITGGACGIGLGIARALIGAGSNVVLADVREEALAAAKTSLGTDDRVETVVLDVTDRDGFAGAADAAQKRFGNVHMLIGNAGVGIGGPVLDATYDDWDWGMGVNLGGVINGLVTFLPRMKAHGEGGQIVTTASKAALLPIPYSSIYITAKAAILGLMESIRGELAEFDIGVSALCPGPVQTNISASGELRPEQFKAKSGYAKFEQQLSERPNSPLWMTPEELGQRVLAGIRRNDLYIITHREFKEGIATRFDAILSSFPDEEIDEARKEAIAFLLSNPVFDAVLSQNREGGE